jgi:hypothetical protein
MKMYFTSGKFDRRAQGIGMDNFSFSSHDAHMLINFDQSLWHITGLLSRYDVELYDTINKKEIFYIYDKKTDKQMIVDELDMLIQDGSVDNVVNYEETLIKEAIEDIDINVAMGIDNGHRVFVEETVFWDVDNHFIIVIGRKQLEKLAYAFEEEKYRNFMRVYKKVKVPGFVTEDKITKSVKKMLSLSKQPRIKQS